MDILLEDTIAALTAARLNELVTQMANHARIIGRHIYPQLDETGILDRLEENGFRLDTEDGLDTDCFGELALDDDETQLSQIVESALDLQRDFDQYMRQYGYRIVWCDFGPDPEDRNEITRQVYLLAEIIEVPEAGTPYLSQVWVRCVLDDDPANDGTVRHWYAVDKKFS